MILREMKILVYSVALTLLCLGAKADSKKVVWISNKGKAGIAIRCTSGVTVFNKFLKPEEETRWKLPAKSHTGICHVDGGGQGYLSVFVESECKSECRWRVYDDGAAKLQLGSGVWKSFPLVSDEESARRSCGDGDDFESPAPQQRHMVENDLNEAPSVLPELVKSPPPRNREHRNGPYVKSPPPKNREEETHWAPPPWAESPPPQSEEQTHWDGDDESPPPKSEEQTPSPSPSPQPDKGGLPPLPQPGSTFYTCIKEDSD